MRLCLQGPIAPERPSAASAQGRVKCTPPAPALRAAPTFAFMGPHPQMYQMWLLGGSGLADTPQRGYPPSGVQCTLPAPAWRAIPAAAFHEASLANLLRLLQGCLQGFLRASLHGPPCKRPSWSVMCALHATSACTAGRTHLCPLWGLTLLDLVPCHTVPVRPTGLSCQKCMLSAPMRRRAMPATASYMSRI